MDEVEQIKDRLDIVDVVSNYLTLKKAGTNLKANCPFHNEKTPSFMVSPERQTFRCFGCFPAGQLIQTDGGLKEIQEIKKGDLVYTHKGRLKKVNIVFERDYSGDLLEITPRMICQPVKVTGDHNIFAIRTKNCKQKSRTTRICHKNCKQNCPSKYFLNYEVEKIHARQLKENDYLLYPLNNFENLFVNEIDVSNYILFEKKPGKPPRSFKHSTIKIDVKFARLAGLYIVEGSSHRAYIRFSFGSHEEHFAKEIVSLLKEIFGLNSSLHYRKDGKTGIEVTCCNSHLSQMFEGMFGKGAENKQVPSFLFNQEEEIKKTLINAIFDGDGTTTKNQKKGIGGRRSITTISLKLTHQIKDILISLGQRPSIHQKKAYISSTGVRHRISHHINWREDDKTHFSDFTEIDGIRYWVLPIKKIIRSNFFNKVYNLNVEEDHSYLTQSFAVANCNEGGDIFTFIEKMEGVDFYNALKILAERAGVELKTKSVKYSEQEFKSDKKTRIYEINDWTKKLYHKVLTQHPKAEKARNYIKSRGLNEKTIKEFEIGYAPNSWDFLVKFLKSKGYEDGEIAQAGVAIKNDKGSVYDRFRGRIIFPINNIMGTTVAFTSRILEEDSQQAKYINSSESPVYTKGKTIYGLDKAKVFIKEKDLAIFVEGNMDVIACHQAGFKNVVATSGTAITPEQLKILNRYANIIALSFDHDEAGEVAMKRAIKIALQNDINTKIISIEGPYKDPDEAIKADPKNWERAIINSKPSLEYWIDLLIRKNPDLSVLAKKSIAREILPVIKTIFSDIEKEYYIKYLANKLSITEKAILGALEKTKKPDDINQTKSGEPNTVKLGVEEKILGILWSYPDLISKCKNISDLKIDDNRIKEFTLMVNKKEINKAEIKPETTSILNQYSMVVLEEIGNDDTDLILSELEYLFARLRSEKKEDLKLNFAQKIQEAEQAGDKEKVKKLLTEFSNLIK